MYKANDSATAERWWHANRLAHFLLHAGAGLSFPVSRFTNGMFTMKCRETTVGHEQATIRSMLIKRTISLQVPWTECIKEEDTW